MSTTVEFEVMQYIDEDVQEGLRVSVFAEALEDGWVAALTLGDHPPVKLLLPELEAMCQRILDELMLAKKHD